MESGLIAKINVILFARPPIAGEAKTRLSQDIGDREAIRIYKKLLTKSVSAVSNVNSLGKTISTYGLDEYHSDLTLEGLTFYLQHERRTMLERLSDTFIESHKTYDHTLVVCADIPGISDKVINAALPFLAQRKVVIGPSADGGIYLFALSKGQEDLLDYFPVGTPGLSIVVLEAVKKKGYGYHILPLRVDIDRGIDLDYARELHLI